MDVDDSESTKSMNIPSNQSIATPEKPCPEQVDDSITFNGPSGSTSTNSSRITSNNTSLNSTNQTNSSMNSPSKPSTSVKSKRRSGGRKHRAGRFQKIKWKPYLQLSFEEKKYLDEREARRAQRIRDKKAAVGIPVAPFNTSQFLINDYLSCHDLKTPDYESMNNGTDEDAHYTSDNSSEEHYHSCSDIGAFYQHAFLEDYANIHEEYLNSLSQCELAAEWVSLEDKIEAVDKQLKELREQRRTMGLDPDHPDAELEKIEVFKSEIEKLFEENHDLETQNEKLRKILESNS
ncbi:hypothetical protein JTE90_029549 [Oedothorax gibbosus]|uniref:Uncharacterized protein n=1 Tax=Oedothorax gibbosus TaxID=931172 RepID=A0AAV6VAM1_9ARAC|nr:hypothetical protein JTE90_029549 [Oedothorax gibbosus]